MMISGCREKYLENRAIHVIVRSPSPAVVKTAKFFWGIFESFTRLNFTDLCEFEREIGSAVGGRQRGEYLIYELVCNCNKLLGQFSVSHAHLRLGSIVLLPMIVMLIDASDGCGNFGW